MLDELLRLLGWIGAAQAALLGSALLARRGAPPADRWLGAGLVAAALASALISLSKSGAALPALEAAEIVATLAAGPLFAGWIAHLAGFPVARWARLAAFAPAALWTIAALLRLPFAGDPLAIRGAVWLLMSWSAAAIALAAARWSRLGARAREAVALGLGGIVLLHLVQLVRLLATDSTSPHLVSATIGLLLIATSFTAFRSARLPFSAGAVAAAGEAEPAQLVARFERLVGAERGFAEAGLTVRAVAQRLGVSALALSNALNRHAGTTFAERLAALRTDEAARLLGDRKLDHLSVEAIGTRSGFGSRSAFFAEFRRRTGASPAEFRARAASGSDKTS